MSAVWSVLRMRFYLVLGIALLLNVVVELAHLPGRLDVAMEVGLLLVVVVMLPFLYLGETRILRRSWKRVLLGVRS